jgi:hypothetical protein
MFIKLTNLNNETTLINSNFLLTVEPNEDGVSFSNAHREKCINGKRQRNA